MDAFFKLIAAAPMFLVSARLLLLFAGILGSDAGIPAVQGISRRWSRRPAGG
jgi:hypothetical protein